MRSHTGKLTLPNDVCGSATTLGCLYSKPMPFTYAPSGSCTRLVVLDSCSIMQRLGAVFDPTVQGHRAWLDSAGLMAIFGREPGLTCSPCKGTQLGSTTAVSGRTLNQFGPINFTRNNPPGAIRTCGKSEQSRPAPTVDRDIPSIG